MSIFYFFIGTIVLLIKKILGFGALPDAEQEITEIGMYFAFRIIGVVMVVVVLYTIFQRLFD